MSVSFVEVIHVTWGAATRDEASTAELARQHIQKMENRKAFEEGRMARTVETTVVGTGNTWRFWWTH